MVRIRYQLLAAESRAEHVRSVGTAVVVQPGDELALFVHLTVDHCSACRESITFDPQVLTLLDENESRDRGGGTIDLRSRWRLRAERPGMTLSG